MIPDVGGSSVCGTTSTSATRDYGRVNPQPNPNMMMSLARPVLATSSKEKNEENRLNEFLTWCN